MTEKFETAFDTFLAGCLKVCNDARKGTNLPEVYLTPSIGKKYVKITETDAWKVSASVWAFVEMATGDVLKPASFRKPAKNARGNIFDSHNGLASIGPYGPAYMRNL